MAHKTVLICFFAAGYIFGISAQLQCQYERDEVAAGRQCQRACQPDGTCRKQNRECVCDGRCGPVCLKKTCPPLSEPENGSVTIDPRERTIDSEAVYACIIGYEIVGNNTRVCQANKTWSGTVPICQQSSGSVITTCRRLPPPVNGIDISQLGSADVVVEGTVMGFACNEGFEKTAGSLRRICREHGIWSGSDVVCSAVADVQCSRNNQEIQNQNRRCLRQCESHSGCIRGRRCVCDDICGLSCILTERADYCEDLPSDRSVRVVITPRNRTFGSIARYTCRNSYEEGGGFEERKCLGSGQWSGDPLSCIPKVRCHQPPVIANTAHNGTRAYYVEGDIVMYSCHYGYYRSGFLPLLRCNGDQWSDIQFQCSPKSCGDPGQILNGRRSGTSFVFLGSVEYTCNPGYELRGLSRRFCQADQEWSGSLPTCHAIRCPDPGVPDDGIKIGSDHSYSKVVSYECNTRYILEGESSIRCQADRTWSAPIPTCRLIQCDPPEEPTNGHANAYLESYGYQGTIRYDCDPGYILRGSSVITCNEHEQWSPEPPLCLGQCRVPSCPRNWHWTLRGTSRYSNCYYYNNDRMVDPGTRLTYRCSNGYFKCQQTEPVCRDRVWEPGTQNLCKAIGCTSLTVDDPQLTARYTYPGGTECVHSTFHQRLTVVEYSCNLGYKIRDGDSSRATCQGRSWSLRQQPRCEEVTCPHIQLDNGAVNYQRNGPFISIRGHTSTAEFHCYPGYKLEGHTLSCYNGTWNGTSPRCIERPCSISFLRWYDNVNIQYVVPPESDDIAEGNKPAGTTAIFVCREHGFEARQTMTCVRGTWTGDRPVCSRIPCGHEGLLNGEVAYTLDGHDRPSPVHGAIRTYNCDPGFIIDDEEPSECDAGSWTRRLPTCYERPCYTDDLLSRDWNVEYIYQGQSDNLAEEMKASGTEARFTCRSYGYEISGQSSRTCRQGRWSGQHPSCVKIPCQFFELSNGRVTYFVNDDVETFIPRHGDFLRPICNRGYEVHGPAQTQCLNGRWSIDVPICVEQPCNKGDLLDGVWAWEIQYSNLGGRDETDSLASPETIATLECNTTGYETTGDKTRMCRRGEWSGANPSCVRVPCEPFQLLNGRVKYFSYDNSETSNPSHGDFLRPICLRGYDVQGPQQTQCWDGQWNLEVPSCVEQSCNKDDLSDGEWEWAITYTDPEGRDETDRLASPDTVATLECNTIGYETIRDKTRRCRRGEWSGDNPSCERVPCESTQLENGVFQYRDIYSMDTSNPKHRDTRIATCNEGYYLMGANVAQCFDGEWEGERTVCLEEPCNVADLPIGNWEVDFTYPEGSEENRSTIPAFTEARFICTVPGEVIAEGGWSTCRQGEWDGQIPSCERSRCGTFHLKNGRVEYRDTNNVNISVPRHGDYMIATCKEGSTLQGTERLRCLEGHWESELPTCQENPCNILEGVPNYLRVIYTAENGSVISPVDGLFPSKSVANLTCKENGTRVAGNVQRTCRKGKWKGKFPTCENDTCPTEDIENGEVTIEDSSSFIHEARHGDLRLFSCDSGYVIDGEERSQCNHGEWSEEKPTCIEAFCTIPTIANGIFTRSNGRQFTESASHLEIGWSKCNDGYIPTEIMWTQCLSGQWSQDILTCEPARCLAVTNTGEYARILYHGSESNAPSFQSGTMVEIVCAEGRVAEGATLSTCTLGRWEPPVGRCVQTAPCDEVEQMEGRIIVYDDNSPNRKRHDSVLTVSCEDNLVVSKQNTSMCSNGEWTPTVATCIKNHALRKPTRQDDTDFNGVANRAVDGNTNGVYEAQTCTHTPNNNADHWWYVNLGSLVLVQEIVVYNRQDSDLRDRLLHASIRVGNNSDDVTLNQLAGTVNNTNINPIHIEVHPPIHGSIVSVSELLPGNPLTLCEVQVFGEWRGCSSGCQVPEIEDGYFTPYQSVSRFQPMDCVEPGSHIYVRCQEPLHYRGAHAYTCQSSGQWFADGELTTCHRCSVNRCIVPHIENGYFSTSQYGSDPRPTGTCVDSESYLYPRCLLGAELVGASRFYCRDGKFMILSNDRRSPVCTEEPRCGRPDVHSLPTHIGNELTLSRHHQDFIQGTTLTSRCHNPLRQRIRGGSVTRRCEGGRWTGTPLQCESTHFEFSITNTVIQNITENGTLVVYPVDGYVNINCNFLLSSTSLVSLHQQTMSASGSLGRGNGRITYRLPDPSPQNSGRYLCETNGRRHSINVLFQAITCSPPTQQNGGYWSHNRQRANQDGSLGYIFTETLSLICPNGYSSTNPAQPTCTHHGTWSNMPQRCTRN